MSAADGTAISSISYFPFGATRTGTVNTDKKFTGQRLDGTGLYYYNARYYDPQIGRFISPDNYVSQPFNPQNLNRYSYCLNNPLKYTDPSGHDQIIETGGVNDNGDTWYTISDGQGNLLAIATGIDDLAQKMSDCESVSRNVDLPLGDGAASFFDAVTGQVDTPEPSLPEVNIPDTTEKNNSEQVGAVIEKYDTVEGVAAIGFSLPLGSFAVAGGVGAIISAGTAAAGIYGAGTIGAAVLTGLLVVSGGIVAVAGIALIVGGGFAVYELITHKVW